MRVANALHIDAAPAAVWAATVDVERWPDWTPTVTAVRLLDGGELALGSVARIRQPMQPESDWVVTELEPGRRFAWETRRAGLRMLGRHEMDSEGEGTRNLLTVEAYGPLAVLLWPVLRVAMRRALADENRGLKAHCERSVGA